MATKPRRDASAPKAKRKPRKPVKPRKAQPASSRKSRANRGLLLSQAKRRKAFTETLADTGNVTKASQAAGVDASTAYKYKAEFPDFREAWDEALDSRLDRLEDFAMNLAEDGWLEPVYHRGERVGLIRKYSPPLILGMLDRRRYQRGKTALLAQGDGPTGAPTSGVLVVRGQLDEVAWEKEYGQ